MKAPFNVTIIQMPGYQYSRALVEVWVYLTDTLQRCGFEARGTVNDIRPDVHNIVLCAHLIPATLIGQIPPSTIIFNSEKLEEKDGWYLNNASCLPELIRTRTVWDYSARNLDHVPHTRKSQIPLYFSSALKQAHPRDADGPLLFYGDRTSWRGELLDGLQARGVPVSIAPVGTYGDERDKLMYRARAVLNLHTNNRYKVFEPVRCFYPLINGIPVITEDFHDEPMFDIFRKSTFVLGADPVADIVALMSDLDRFKATAKQHIATFAESDPLPHIKQAAEQYLDTVKGVGRQAVSA